MGEGAAYIVFGIVLAVGFLVSYFATKSSKKTKPVCYSSGRRRDDSPPPTPPPSAFTSTLRKRCKSPERRPSSGSEATKKPCQDCGESPCVQISPCNHESLCMGCLSTRIETNDTCPQCKVRIDSCLPNIPSFGKCKSCGKFTKVQKFNPCGYLISLCNKCFDEL